MTDSKNRWYDKNPTVSLAISLLRNTAPNNQTLVAGLLLEKNKELNIVGASIQHLPFSKRWYDFDENLYLALEVLRHAPSTVQNDIAIEIINYLCTLDSTVTERTIWQFSDFIFISDDTFTRL